MKARMQELLGLLTMVVERVRTANARAEQAEDRAAQMTRLLDALSDENAALRTDLDESEAAYSEAQAAIRALRDQVEAGSRLAEALEARACAAELRIHRAADALGLATASDQPPAIGDVLGPSVALH